MQSLCKLCSGGRREIEACLGEEGECRCGRLVLNFNFAAECHLSGLACCMKSVSVLGVVWALLLKDDIDESSYLL